MTEAEFFEKIKLSAQNYRQKATVKLKMKIQFPGKKRPITPFIALLQEWRQTAL